MVAWQIALTSTIDFKNVILKNIFKNVILIETLDNDSRILGCHPGTLLDVIPDPEHLLFAVPGNVVVGEMHEPLDQVRETHVGGQAEQLLACPQLPPS